MKLLIRTMLVTWAVMAFIAVLALALPSVLAPIREHSVPIRLLETCANQAVSKIHLENGSVPTPSNQPCPVGRLVALENSEGFDLSGHQLSRTEIRLVHDAQKDRNLILANEPDSDQIALRVDGDKSANYVYLAVIPVKQPYFVFRHLATFAPIFIAGFLSLLIAAYVVNPLTKLNAAAEMFGGGDLKVRIDSSLAARKDELGDLARTFNGMAERIESLVSRYKDFLAHASHELGSPLTRLNIALALARRKAGTELEQEHDRISQESVRLNSLVQELLLLARLESGNEVSREPLSFDVRDVIEEVHRDASFEAEELGKVVSLTISESFRLSGYPVLLHRAVENVLRNALRFAEKRVCIEISRSRTETDSNGLIVITDDGPGIAAGQEEAIFEPFLTLPGAETGSVGGGSGLGLAIARQAVLANGGQVRALRVRDLGLVVEIELPPAS